MAHIVPFKAVRPSKKHLQYFSSKSYKNYTEEELQNTLAKNPLSFLSIIHLKKHLSDSMTKAERYMLVKNKYEDFKVNVLSQEQDNPYDCELKLLAASNNQTFIVREVELIGSQRPVVIARSLIPLTADTSEILKIGAKPLGEILFNDPEIKRGHLEVGSFNKSWARRSTFKIGKTKLLVSEIFLESLYA